MGAFWWEHFPCELCGEVCDFVEVAVRRGEGGAEFTVVVSGEGGALCGEEGFPWSSFFIGGMGKGVVVGIWGGHGMVVFGCRGKIRGMKD